MPSSTLPVTSSPLPVTSPPRYRLETLSLSYHLPSNSDPLLSNITCAAHPSELLAIVGPSGAGKTSLLSILAGSLPFSSGHILLNSIPLSSSSSSSSSAMIRRLSAYVTQDDTLFPLLTVHESLLYSARLRLTVTSHSEPDQRVLHLLKELSLDHVADSRVGSLSGGERRRVSIGTELVHDPQIILLDEPTSGLDSASALHVVALLKSMASHHGKTVILTIHQPGFRILNLLDNILLLSKGSVKHFGPLTLLQKTLSDSGHSIPSHVNLLEFAMDAVDTLPTQVVVVVRSPGPDEEICSLVTTPNKHKDKFRYANGHFQETRILTERFFKNMLRTKQLSTARMIQCLVAGVGLGTIFTHVENEQARVGFFAFTLTFLLSSTTEGLPVFLQERRILTKETCRGAYRVSSYVAANTLVFLPFLLLASLLYAAPVYLLVGLQKEFDVFMYFWLVVWLVMLMANSFVAFFSALVPNFIMGNSLIAGFMGSFFLFSGYFIAERNIPKYWIFMHYLSLFKYPFEGFMVNEYGGERGRWKCVEKGDVVDGGCVLDGEMFLKQQGLVESQKWTSVCVMLGFVCGYRLLCFLVLWVRCSSRWRR